MLFNSYIFILLFLPVALILYYGLLKLKKVKLAQASLIGMCLWFYGYAHVAYLAILLVSIGFNFGVSRLFAREYTAKWRKALLTFGIAANAAVIFYFKYYNFFVENMSRLFGAESTLLQVVMPLGISFFTFQQIAYLVDSYRGETKDYSLLEYTLFVAFFPVISSGPITLHKEMMPQFRDAERQKFSQEWFSQGLWMFAMGLAKKVLLADTLGKGVTWGFANVGALSGLDTVVVALLYTLQIYFDFSGYCDMASGIAGMFRFKLPLNFNSPYKAASILDFWQRWHMTLTRFLRTYIYFPLGGSRNGKVRTYLNIMVVFLVSGIWHGANWTFMLWGALHGAFQVLNRMFGKLWDKLPKVLRVVATFALVSLLWVLFRAESVADALTMYGNLFKPWNLELSPVLLQQFGVLEFTYVVEHVGFLQQIVAKMPWIYMAVVLTVALFICFVPKNCQEKKFTPTLGRAVGTVILLVWSVLSLSGLSSFLYFNF